MCEHCAEPDRPVWIGTQRYPADEVPTSEDDDE